MAWQEKVKAAIEAANRRSIAGVALDAQGNLVLPEHEESKCTRLLKALGCKHGGNHERRHEDR